MKLNKTSIVACMAFLLIFSACKNEDEPVPSGTFTVTIENVFEGKDYFVSGTTEGIGPGSSFSFSFDAGKGHFLSFATMLAQSNDLFYAPAENGIPLHDANGAALTGDITAMLDLWDAGTEVNEEPGAGANQAPRQSGPDTGPEENGTVRLIMDVSDGYSYPADEDVLKVVISHDGGTRFTVEIENVSGASSLVSPLAPGVWVVHGANQAPLFTENSTASVGLERLAEDGNNAMMADNLEQNSGLVSPFAPGAYALFQGGNPLFVSGQEASAALEALAEDGDPSGFSGIQGAGIFNTPSGASGPGPIFPGESYAFSFDAEEGDLLSFATMLVQSNDLFVGSEGLPLFTNGTPLGGDITGMMRLWDAKTEANEYPGAGNSQAPRQAGPDTGMDESGNIEEVNDSFSYPPVSDMIRVTITNQ